MNKTLWAVDYIKAALNSRWCLGEVKARPDDLKLMCQSNKDISLEIRSINLRQNTQTTSKELKKFLRGVIGKYFFNLNLLNFRY